MTVKKSYPVLYEAYVHYQKTGERHFTVIPKNSDYLFNVLRTVPYLQEHGYIDNVSDNLLDDSAISLIPLEHMSFRITYSGIRFAETNGES